MSGSELANICLSLLSDIAPACIASHSLSVIFIDLSLLETEPTFALYFFCVLCANLRISSGFNDGSSDCFFLISLAVSLTAVLSFTAFFKAVFSLASNDDTSFLYIFLALGSLFKLPVFIISLLAWFANAFFYRHPLFQFKYF